MVVPFGLWLLVTVAQLSTPATILRVFVLMNAVMAMLAPVAALQILALMKSNSVMDHSMVMLIMMVFVTCLITALAYSIPINAIAIIMV